MKKIFLLTITLTVSLFGLVLLPSIAEAAPSCSFSYSKSSITPSWPTNDNQASLQWTSSADTVELDYSCTNYSYSGGVATYSSGGRSGTTTTLNANPALVTWDDSGNPGADETCTFIPKDKDGIAGSPCSDTLRIDLPPAPSCYFYYGDNSIASGGSSTIRWGSNSSTNEIDYSCTNYSYSASTKIATYSSGGRSGTTTTLNADPALVTWDDSGNPGADETCTFTAKNTHTGQSSTCSDTLVINSPVCDLYTPCDETFNGKYCRSIDGGAYQWIDIPTCTENIFYTKIECEDNGSGWTHKRYCNADDTHFFWDGGGNYSIPKFEIDKDINCGSGFFYNFDKQIEAILPGAVRLKYYEKYRWKEKTGTFPNITAIYHTEETDGNYVPYFKSISYDWGSSAGYGRQYYDWDEVWQGVTSPTGTQVVGNCYDPYSYNPLQPIGNQIYSAGSYYTVVYTGERATTKFEKDEGWGLSCFVGVSCPPTPSTNPMVNLTASSTTVAPGESFDLTWTTENNPDSCIAGGDNVWISMPITTPIGSKSSTGGTQSLSYATAGSKTFDITCSKAGYPDVSSFVTVNVGNSIGVSLIPSSSDVYRDETFNLTWNTTGTPDSCEASGDWSGIKNLNGVSGDFSSSTDTVMNFVITCKKAGYADASASATVTVSGEDPNAPGIGDWIEVNP